MKPRAAGLRALQSCGVLKKAGIKAPSALCCPSVPGAERGAGPYRWARAAPKGRQPPVVWRGHYVPVGIDNPARPIGTPRSAGAPHASRSGADVARCGFTRAVRQHNHPPLSAFHAPIYFSLPSFIRTGLSTYLLFYLSCCYMCYFIRRKPVAQGRFACLFDSPLLYLA